MKYVDLLVLSEYEDVVNKMYCDIANCSIRIITFTKQIKVINNKEYKRYYHDTGHKDIVSFNYFLFMYSLNDYDRKKYSILNMNHSNNYIVLLSRIIIMLGSDSYILDSGNWL